MSGNYKLEQRGGGYQKLWEIAAASVSVKKVRCSNHNLLLKTGQLCPPCVPSPAHQLQGFGPGILPVIVFEVVDTLPFDGLLQDLRLAAAELLPHLHQPGRGAKNELTLKTWLMHKPCFGGNGESQLACLRCDNSSTYSYQRKKIRKKKMQSSVSFFFFWNCS